MLTALKMNQPIDCHTTQPTGDPSPHHLYPQCHEILLCNVKWINVQIVIE